MNEEDQAIINSHCEGSLKELETHFRERYDRWLWDTGSDWDKAIMDALERKIKEIKEFNSSISIPTAKISSCNITAAKISNCNITDAKISDCSVDIYESNGVFLWR